MSISEYIKYAIERQERFPHDIMSVVAKIVDGEKVRCDTWYKLKNGRLMEAGK